MERIEHAFWRVYKLDYAGLKLIAEANDPDVVTVDPLSLSVDDIIGQFG